MTIPTTPILRQLVAGCALGLLCTACAWFDRDNQRVLAYLDRELTPPTAAGRWAAAPVALPAGLVAWAVDAFVVHPVAVVDDAWGDTVELLWTAEHDSRLRRVLFTPLAAICTPLVFAGDWLGRSLLAIPPREEKP